MDAYPVKEPIKTGTLKVAEPHELYYEEHGSPGGTPVIVLHGGPGVGCAASFAGYFDPDYYRVVLLDQRGAKRSQPHAEMQGNTTQDLIADLEQLREQLAIERWMVFGGSWGSILGLAYAQAHPEACLGLVLRGLCRARREDGEHLFAGMGRFHPEAWETFLQALPEQGREHPLETTYKLVMDPDPAVHMPIAKAFAAYDMLCATLKRDDRLLRETDRDAALCLGLTRSLTHYIMHDFFLEPDQLLRDMPKIQQLPGLIVHGRYDIITPIDMAYAFHQAWPGSEFHAIEGFGHASSEKGVSEALVLATERMKARLVPVV